MPNSGGGPSPPVSAWEPVEEGLRRYREPNPNPEKSDAEREGAAREKLSRGGYWPHLPYLPKLWGMTEHARDLRARGAERISVKGKGVQTLFPASDSRGPAVPSLAIDPDATHDRTWAPLPERPEEEWGRSSRAVAIALSGDRERVRGMERAARMFNRFPVVGSVAVCTEVSRASAGKVAVGKARKVVSARKARDLASVSVRATVGVSDLESARVKRAARGIILCDARKAPIRQIVAF